MSGGLELFSATGPPPTPGPPVPPSDFDPGGGDGGGGDFTHPLRRADNAWNRLNHTVASDLPSALRRAQTIREAALRRLR